MYRIYKTISEILVKKRKVENSEYIRGFSDCFELMKIGFEKLDQINLILENTKLRHILYHFLDYEINLSENQIARIKELATRYDEEFVFIENLLTKVILNHPDSRIVSPCDELEVKMQNLIVTDILFKLIKQNFQLSSKQEFDIKCIVESSERKFQKVQDIICYLSKAESMGRLLDYQTLVDLKDKLAKQNTFLQTFVEFLLSQYISKYDRFELQELYNRKTKTLVKYELILSYLHQLKKDPLNKPFELSAENKAAISKIMTESIQQKDLLQELFNYINFIIANDEKRARSVIKKKQGKLID